MHRQIGTLVICLCQKVMLLASNLRTSSPQQKHFKRPDRTNVCAKSEGSDQHVHISNLNGVLAVLLYDAEAFDSIS